MNKLQRAALVTGLLVCTAPSGAADTTAFLGTPGQPGDVRGMDDLGLLAVQAPELVGVVLLDLEVTGRSGLDALDAARPWRHDLPGAAARISLPGGGSVYAYRRDKGDGTASFGRFLVDAAGSPRVLLERPGTGLGGADDPFVPRFAVSPAGDALLFATTPAAGGDLLEVDPLTGAATDRTAGLAPGTWIPESLLLTANAAFASDGASLARYPRSGGALALPLPLTTPSGLAAWVPGDLVLAGDGLQVLAVAGDGPLSEYPFRIDAAGVPTRVVDTPAELDPAGHLPAHLHGPYMALSTDGSHAAWRVRTPLTTEAWMRRVQPAAPAAVHLSADALFLDTLDEVAPFAFFHPARLILGVGEIADPLLGGSEALDLFGVTLDAAGTPIFEALSATSGDLTAPFTLKGVISPNLMAVLPGTSDILVHDDKANRLALVGPGHPSVELEPNAKNLRLAVASGPATLLVVQREFATAKDLRALRLDHATGTAVDIAVLPDVLTFDRAAGRGDGWVAFVLGIGAAEWTLAIDAATGAGLLPVAQPFSAGPTLAFHGGDLHLSSGPAGSPALFARQPFPGLPVLNALAPTVGFLLP